MTDRLGLVASTLDPKGPIAREIVGLWWFMLVIGVGVFVLFAALLGAGLWRRRSGEDARTRPRVWIVSGGVLLPTVVVLAVLVATLRTMRAVPDEVGSGATVVEVIGHQYWWEVRYPDHDVVTANEIHVPAGVPVLLRLRSADVIHSFWVPSLAGKMDLLPEAVNTLVIESDGPGVHRGVCAEFCGVQHANMGLLVFADEPAEFERWLDAQRQPAADPGPGAADQGQVVFMGAACGSCHTVRGTDADGVDGPDLTHLASRSTLAAGTIRNSTQDLRAWLSDPHAVKEGVLMEPADVDPDELGALVAYLEGLE